MGERAGNGKRVWKIEEGEKQREGKGYRSRIRGRARSTSEGYRGQDLRARRVQKTGRTSEKSIEDRTYEREG